MFKKLSLTILIVCAVLMRAQSVKAAEKVAGASAVLETVEDRTLARSRRDQFKKREAIKRLLQRWNSPLVDHVDDFMTTCKEQDLDCYLLPSITGLESGFGRQIMPGSYNPFGWGGGLIFFESWGDGIATVGTGLRENYINQGATSIEAIGRIYAESPTWAYRVRGFMAEFESEEAKVATLPAGFDIQ